MVAVLKQQQLQMKVQPFSRAYLRTDGIALIRLFSSTFSSCDVEAAGVSSG
jgi:hypothetical protein